MYSFESRVRYSEVGENFELKVTSLVDYLQDCSTFHSEQVGLGPRHVAEVGYAWLLSAWQIEIRELPSFGDEIRVSTWATSFKGLRANRNFTICRADDERGEEPLVLADSSWFMFDANAGRPVRATRSEYEAYLSDDAPLDLPPTPKILRATAEGVATAPVVVTASHIDTNHHVNNAQYVSLGLAAMGEVEGVSAATGPNGGQGIATPALGGAPAGDTSTIRHIDVHYSVAAKLGDTIYPHVHHEPDGSVIATLDDEQGKPYALVRAIR